MIRTANGRAFRTAIIPSGNVVTTADELSKLYMCLADDGMLDGARHFDRKTPDFSEASGGVNARTGGGETPSLVPGQRF